MTDHFGRAILSGCAVLAAVSLAYWTVQMHGPSMAFSGALLAVALLVRRAL